MAAILERVAISDKASARDRKKEPGGIEVTGSDVKQEHAPKQLVALGYYEELIRLGFPKEEARVRAVAQYYRDIISKGIRGDGIIRELQAAGLTTDEAVVDYYNGCGLIVYDRLDPSDRPPTFQYRQKVAMKTVGSTVFAVLLPMSPQITFQESKDGIQLIEGQSDDIRFDSLYTEFPWNDSRVIGVGKIFPSEPPPPFAPKTSSNKIPQSASHSLN